MLKTYYYATANNFKRRLSRVFWYNCTILSTTEYQIVFMDVRGDLRLIP